jgi:hypothetical protein
LLEVVNHTRGTTIFPRSKLQTIPFQVGPHIKEVHKPHKRGSLKKHLAKLWARLVHKEKLYFKSSKQEVKITRKQKL